MDDRTRIGIQVWVIADKYNISQTTVHTIINSYLSYCKDLLVQGERVDFFGLVSVVPNVINNNFSTTLAYNCEKIADMLALPQHTVYRVMEAYIEDAIESIQKGVTIEIRGIVVCKPIYENGKVSRIHSNISQSLKNILVSNDTNVTSLRVHTYKSLKDKLA
jgi:nucleoid DNA-binding protein